jgi:ornithine decarboxylase
LHNYLDARAVVRATAPDQPAILNRPHAAARAARFFVEKFPGKSLYAVKANPSPDLLRVLWDAGVTHYDVASITEVRLVRSVLPEATLCFMHPVKTPVAIAEAYFQHGVRTFSLDTVEELEKIIDACRNPETGEAPRDLRLCVRLRVSSEYSELSLASKFGCDLIEAPQLLQQARQHCDWLGVCFHVGSQAMTPFAFVQALDRTRAAIASGAIVPPRKSEASLIFSFLMRGEALRFLCDEVYSYADDSHLATFKERLFKKHAPATLETPTH